MAINIYGSCTGNSGGKYDIWLNVKQNSQSVVDNKSNITVKLLLKRNDGYTSSAYNLTESANTVKLLVDGKEKVNKNLSIDTRNNATVTLALWSGDVAHNTDGTLSLSLEGSFTMDGTSLSGGAVSGTFDCTDIPRLSTLTLSVTSLNPGDTVGATVSVASSEFNHKIKWRLGDSSVTHALSSGIVQDVFTVPLSWAEEITNGKSGNITVTLATYKGTKKIGTKSYSLKLVIPNTSEFFPEFDFVIERIDNSIPVEMGEYVKGKSQIKLNIDNLILKYGAEVAQVTAKVGTASKNTVPATFDLLKAGETEVSLTIKDSRGFSVTKRQTINVLSYSAPAISVDSLYRCDENGNRTTSGTYLFCNLQSVYSSLNGKNIPHITYKYKRADGDSFSGEIEINENICVLGAGSFLNNSSYVVAFKITDSVTTENDFVEVLIPSTDIPFNIRNGGKGAAFGCYAENENELTVAWDLNVKGNLVYENTDIELASFVEDKRGLARYFPCLEIVFVRLRFTATQAISANENHVLASFPNRIPSLLTPVTVTVNNSIGNKCTGYIKSETGELVVNSEKEIQDGDYIYVSGVYFAYRN